ncbi:iron ABC transporter substrate-binding protein [Bogoriella caseilytica]|uniref:Iron(III) transport system substrate-binding protein n=1 Tax=Bogoriella caseilytica TaxID=56055 RepID=A0A3N2B9X6_9MICO|nr:iron ABC transporter substrate-binding protein [Bogoriella caseilytica]ROR71952.1 iron(III) transport system substrate-binding protein [Bogoriella caseilytica]
MKSSRRVAVTATAAAFSLALAGCNDSGTDSPDGADVGAEGSGEPVVLYSGRGEDLIQPIIDEFTEQTGIEVEVRYGNTPEMAAQVIQEGDASPADVYLGQDAGSLGAISAEGLFATLPDEILEQVPAEYRAADGSWVGLSGRARVLGYSSASVESSDLPDSIFELTEPEWQGRLGVAPTNASFQSFVTALRVTEGDDVALEWLEGIAGNDPQIYEGNGGIVADLQNDSIDVGLINHYYVYGTAQEEGVEPEDLNVQLHFFTGGDVGGLLNVSGAGLVGEADNEDALALVEFLLGETAQEFFRDDNSEYPVVPDLGQSPHLPALEDLELPDIDLNDLGDLQQTVELISQAGLA